MNANHQVRLYVPLIKESMTIKSLCRLLLCVLFPVIAYGQTTPNLGLTLPVQGSQNWGTVVNSDLTIIDTFAGTVGTFPSSGTGVLFGLTPTTSRFAAYTDIVPLFGSGSCVGFLKNDGTCANISPGLTSFTTGSLAPLFSATLGPNPTTSPVLTFTASSIAANSVFGNFTGGVSAPTFSNAPVFSAASLTNFPTLNQSTTGNAATSTNLAGTPTLCTIAGQFPKGILPNGNATGCAAPTVTGLTSIGLTTPTWLTVTGSPLTTNGTLAVTATGGLASNSFLATPDGSTGILGVRQIAPGDLPLATTSTFGAVKPDGTTITISSGIITAVGGGGGAGVASINTTTGAFTFTGGGVTCVSTTCTFSSTGATAFSALTGSTNTTAAMLVGTGASLAATGTGAITATAMPYTGLTGSVPTWNQNTTGSAATLTTSRTLAGNAFNGSSNIVFSNKFIVQGITDSGLTGAQFLGALATGIVKNTTTTGVLSIAAAGTDYLAPTGSATGLSKASAAAFGVSECDNTTISCAGGIFSAIGSGSGTVTHTAGALTSLALVIGNGSADIKVDSGCSTDGTGDLTCASIASSGTINGFFQLTSIGIAPITVPANTFQMETPNSVTAYRMVVPGAAPAISGQYWVCTAATPSVCSWSGIANATTSVGTSAINANTCSGLVTVTMTGVATTSTFAFTPNADVSAISGWGATGGLVIDAWPTANTLNYKVCNSTGSNITPSGSVTFNVSAR